MAPGNAIAEIRNPRLFIAFSPQQVYIPAEQPPRSSSLKTYPNLLSDGKLFTAGARLGPVKACFSEVLDDSCKLTQNRIEIPGKANVLASCNPSRLLKRLRTLDAALNVIHAR